jgi:hypothetical protein
MKYVISAILGAIAFLFALLIGKRAGILDNGRRAGQIRGELADSAERAKDIASGIVDAQGDNDAARRAADGASQAIDRASDAIDQGIGIIRDIRKRGKVDSSRADSGASD